VTPAARVITARLLAACAGAGLLAAPGCAGRPRPNILLVVCDTVRADHVSADGYARPTTPQIDALGRDGAVFLRAYTPSPWTLPAHASLFTGLYPSSHGADSGNLRLDPSLPFLARRLREAGYRTLAYVENPWVGKDYNFQEGFDTFDEVWRGVHGTEDDMGAAAVSEKVARWLEWRDGNADARRQPFFVFINYFEPHLPYNPPEPERGRFLRPGADAAEVERLRRFKHPEEVRQILGFGSLGPADFALLADLYDGEIAYVDRRLGEIAGLLRARGLLDGTVVAVTSDHGEMIGEHGLMDHKLNLYEPVLRIPLILRYPRAVRPGQRIDAPVMLQDLYPTLLALAGVDTASSPGNPRPAGDLAGGQAGGPTGALTRGPAAAEARTLPGVTGLSPGAIRGSTVDDPLIAEYARPAEFFGVMKGIAPGADLARWDRTLAALQAGGAKLVWASDGRHELYDLGSDPGEGVDLAAADPHETAALAGRLEAWLTRPAARPPLRLAPATLAPPPAIAPAPSRPAR
jgi:arylsulfatase A-like enzyme